MASFQAKRVADAFFYEKADFYWFFLFGKMTAFLVILFTRFMITHWCGF